MSEPPLDPEPIFEGWSSAPVDGSRIDVSANSVVAGDPGGARVEIASDRLHAYNATGTETATIRGEEGVFVGGEFRTSDTLPGQVTLADDAYINSATGVAHPGIRVEPLDTSTMARPPGIGPGDLGVYVDGGSDTSGRRSYLRASPDASLMRSFRENGTTGGAIQTSPAESLMRTYREDGTLGGGVQTSPVSSFIFTNHEDGTMGGAIQTSPTESLMRTYREDGTTGGLVRTGADRSLVRTYSGNSSESGWVRVRPQDAELAYVAPNNTYFSQIKADANEAFLYTRAGGANRYLSVDANGVWVKTNKSGTTKSYNLEETAQDSGWQSFTVEPGVTGSGTLAWRNKGGIIFFRGTASAAWVANTWNTIATGLTPEWCPGSSWVVNEAGAAVGGARLRVTSTGTLAVNPPTAGSAAYFLTAMTYPAG